MVGGWKRAFCTTFGKDREQKLSTTTDHQNQQRNNHHNDKSRFGLFSNPSTPRLQSQSQQQQPVSISTSNLRCKTTVPAAVTDDYTASSAPVSPRLHVKTAKNSPRFFFRSNPSSPKSPSSFSLLKSTLRLSKNRCGICLQSAKTGQGTAIFTAECSHGFHFPCIAAHVRKQGGLVCPVCSANWKELPLLALRPKTNTKPEPPKQNQQQQQQLQQQQQQQDEFRNQKRDLSPLKNLKVYNDDEPLMSPTASSGFVPIPESDENEDEEDEVQEFQGFFVDNNSSATSTASSMKSGQRNATETRNIGVKLSSESAIVSVNRSYESYAVVLKLKAPPALQNHAPIDLVTVIDVSGKMSGEKQKAMKRSMRLVISSLSSNDRLSIVAFSATSKRLFPLRRMTANGKRSARRIIDALGCIGEDSCAADAVKKAMKVLEDRREKNSVSAILLLSDGHEKSTLSHDRNSVSVPVHTFYFSESIAYDGNSGQLDDCFSECFDRILSVTVQDLCVELGFVTGSAQSQISAIYKCITDQPSAVEPGLIRFDELYADDERELLLELKVPSSASRSHHHVLTIQSCYKDPSSQKIVYTTEQALLVPRPQSVRSSNPNIERLRYLFVATRSIAESRRLVERNDLSGAHHMLSSAKALLGQANSGLANEYVRSLEGELAEVNSQRLHQLQVQRRRTVETAAVRKECGVFVDEKGEPLTPTSAWRAAERLAKVAIMRKSLNRVSDLHGFENARFGI